jgi:BirA family biotin operon repressor/biotin-[acetyl-CoA-carboxylase] ligase
VRFELIRHDVVDSTSERAFAAIANGTARHGDVHLAREQTRGRGRFGRTWFSPPGEGLYMSIVLLPPPPPWNPSALTMAAGLALFDAARALGVERSALKWPNDLVVDRAKLAGVLVETRGLDAAAPHYVVGVGVNVLQREFPAELAAERAVTSFARLGIDASVERASSAVLDAFASRIEDLELRAQRIVDDYLAASSLAEGAITVRVGTAQHHGRLIELSLERGIVLQSTAGSNGAETRIPLEFVREIRRAERL